MYKKEILLYGYMSNACNMKKNIYANDADSHNTLINFKIRFLVMKTITSD